MRTGLFLAVAFAEGLLPATGSFASNGPTQSEKPAYCYPVRDVDAAVRRRRLAVDAAKECAKDQAACLMASIKPSEVADDATERALDDKASAENVRRCGQRSDCSSRPECQGRYK